MRIHRVTKARAEVRCNKCGNPIKVGESYLWWKHRNSPKTRWHREHGLPKQSDLTTSDKLSRIYATQESLDDTLGILDSVSAELGSKGQLVTALDDLVSAMDEAISEANDVADEYEQSADNIEEYFGETSQVSEMRDKADNIREWADELESAKGDADRSSEVEALEEEELESFIQEVHDAVDNANGVLRL